MYEKMTAAYHESNAYANSINKEKVFEYTILDRSFHEVEKGFCTNVQRRYDPCYDWNWVSFTDINTNKTHSICQFYVKMKEVNQVKEMEQMTFKYTATIENPLKEEMAIESAKEKFMYSNPCVYADWKKFLGEDFHDKGTTQEFITKMNEFKEWIRVIEITPTVGTDKDGWYRVTSVRVTMEYTYYGEVSK